MKVSDIQIEQLRLIFPNVTEQELEEKISNIIHDFLCMNEIKEDVFAHEHLQLALAAIMEADNIGQDIWQEYLLSIEEKASCQIQLTAKDLITATYALALCRDLKLRQEI
jgi:translation elongation factor EF-1beta